MNAHENNTLIKFEEVKDFMIIFRVHDIHHFVHSSFADTLFCINAALAVTDFFSITHFRKIAFFIIIKS